MAIKLSDKPNVTAPGGDYSYGDIRNRDGLTPGTPGSREVYADFHQFFERMVGQNEDVSFNGNPDNDANGYQLFQALIYSMPRKIVKEFTSVFDGDVISISGQDLQSDFPEAVQDKPFYKGTLLDSSPREAFIDYQIQVIFENTAGKWKNFEEIDNLITERDDTSGDLTITLDGPPVSPAARVRVILIG